MKKISDEIDLYNLCDVKLQVFWAIDHLESDSKDRFSPVEIARFLVEEKRIMVSRQAVLGALKSSMKDVHKSKDGKYKLMETGRRYLAANNTSNVIFIEANKPFEAKTLSLKNLFGNLKKEVLICDPYFDTGTLDFIFINFSRDISIKFLTQKVTDNPTGILKRHLSDLEREGFEIEIRTYDGSELHDRYVIDQGHFWLSGNSFNKIGSKESFIVLLGEDVRQSMYSMFNARWKSSSIF